MFSTYIALASYPPAFLNQVAYCDETRTWYIALIGPSGHLRWHGNKTYRSN